MDESITVYFYCKLKGDLVEKSSQQEYCAECYWFREDNGRKFCLIGETLLIEDQLKKLKRKWKKKK